MGRVLDTRRTPKQLDGNQLHFTMPVSSRTRIAIVYYCHRLTSRTTDTKGKKCEHVINNVEACFKKAKYAFDYMVLGRI